MLPTAGAEGWRSSSRLRPSELVIRSVDLSAQPSKKVLGHDQRDDSMKQRQRHLKLLEFLDVLSTWVPRSMTKNSCRHGETRSSQRAAPVIIVGVHVEGTSGRFHPSGALLSQSRARVRERVFTCKALCSQDVRCLQAQGHLQVKTSSTLACRAKSCKQ